MVLFTGFDKDDETRRVILIVLFLHRQPVKRRKEGAVKPSPVQILFVDTALFYVIG